MKIQDKAASTITLFGVVIILLMSCGYYFLVYDVVIEKEIENIKYTSEEIAQHVESHIEGKTTTATTLSSAPIIKSSLLKSNAAFASLPDVERKQKIDSLNQQWMKSTASNDSFVTAHMTNPVAEYLKYQQTLIAGEYGEIFLTNRYGVMIATTGKLSTLAHAHKYWWKAGYDDGKGRIFLDDRGFDTSAKGYVLGVVIPIKDKNEIIGILKCNVNIKGVLNDVVQDFDNHHFGRLKIVRTGGLIVMEQGVTPLSTGVNNDFVKSLRQKVGGTTSITEHNEKQLVAFSPIPITMGSTQFGFGGSKESIDHIKGNKGEGWHAVIFLNKESTLKKAHEVLLAIVIIGIIGTILTAAVALFLGKWETKPIIELATTAQAIGEGRLETRTEVLSNDEIGLLAKSINTMARNIQEAITTKDALLVELNDEIRQRKKAEEDIKTLSGLIPICMHCKEIRDDKGFWNKIEEYISKHSEAKFSHGCCPGCLAKHYPHIAKLNKD